MSLSIMTACSASDHGPIPTDETSMPVSTICVETPTDASPVETLVLTPASTLIPTVPTITPVQVGSFVLTRALAPEVNGVLPVVELPLWIEPNGEKETWFLDQVMRAYQPLTKTCDSETCAELFKTHYSDVIARVDDFLGIYPDSDGAIPVWMMLGHIHSYQVGWYWERSAELLGQEYEKAITLLLERHPERLPYIVNDLIGMGLPINWVQSTDLSIDGGEVLLFTYQFSPRYGEPKGQTYTFVREPGHSWMFVPMPTRYAYGWQHGADAWAIADINADALYCSSKMVPISRLSVCGTVGDTCCPIAGYLRNPLCLQGL